MSDSRVEALALKAFVLWDVPALWHEELVQLLSEGHRWPGAHLRHAQEG